MTTATSAKASPYTIDEPGREIPPGAGEVTATPKAARHLRPADACFVVAGLAALAGMVMGIAMGIAQDFTLAPAQDFTLAPPMHISTFSAGSRWRFTAFIIVASAGPAAGSAGPRSSPGPSAPSE